LRLVSRAAAGSAILGEGRVDSGSPPAGQINGRQALSGPRLRSFESFRGKSPSVRLRRGETRAVAFVTGADRLPVMSAGRLAGLDDVRLLMRLGVTLAGVLILCMLGLVSVIHGSDVLPRGSALVVGTIVFCSCITGMMIAHIYVAYERAESTARELSHANAELERLVAERTQRLSEKVMELETARAQAVEANAAKSRFLATMSHELRTPLNAILGFSEIIEREMYGPAGDARYLDYAKHIHESGAHLLSLIREILDLSKIEAGKMELQCEPIAVAELIDEARMLSRADASHALTVLVEDDLPRLFADRRGTLQMLLNLLSNAVKFTPRGGAIAATAIQRGDGGVTLSVRDSGMGIAKADIPKALAAYSQVANPEVRAQDGTGLGLPIVQALIKLHGGTFEFDSELGEGTSVTLHFPPERSLRGATGSTEVAA
jgi:signal transduction histidine kinase